MSQSDNSPFSESELRRFASEICSGDAEIFVELLGDCQTDLQEQFNNLEKARKSKNWRDLNRAAHSMKSAARTFGSPLVKTLSYDVENVSEDGVEDKDIPALDSKILELKKSKDQFIATLAKIAKDPGPFL